MIDVNCEVKKILAEIDDVKAVFYHPQKFNELPVISYYELITKTGLCYDNEEQAQRSYVVIDVWGKSGGECARLAIRIDEVMQNSGWYRSFARDLPPENGICHKNMRFYKQIFLGGMNYANK